MALDMQRTNQIMVCIEQYCQLIYTLFDEPIVPTKLFKRLFFIFR